MASAHRVPALHAIHRHVGQVAAAGQEFADQLAHGKGVVHRQNALLLAAGQFEAAALDLGRGPPTTSFSMDRTISSTSTIRTGAPSSMSAAALMSLNLAEPGIERLHHQLAFPQKAVHDQPVTRVAVARARRPANRLRAVAGRRNRRPGGRPANRPAGRRNESGGGLPGFRCFSRCNFKARVICVRERRRVRRPPRPTRRAARRA